MVLTGFILDEIVAVRLLLRAALILVASESLAGGDGRCLSGR
jgi:hypothetical protein